MVIVEQQGISAAAAHLGRKQPTVSNALVRLEQQINYRLIERKPNFFKVSPAGERLYSECVDIFGTVARLPNLISDSEDEISGHVSLGMASHVISPLLDTILAEFHSRHPGVSLSIAVHESREVITSLLQKRVSLGICLAENQDPRLDHAVFYRQFFGFFCGPKHRLFGKQALIVNDLKDEPLVSFQTDHEDGALRAITRLRAKAGMTEPLTGVSSSLQEVRRMIIAGLGIGPLPLHVAERDVEDGLLWQLPPYTKLPPIDIFLVTNPRANKNRAEKALIEMLSDAIEKTPMEERTYTSASMGLSEKNF